MVRVQDIINIVNCFAPEGAAYSKDYDNVGLIVGDRDAAVTTVLCCLDVSNDVVDQAQICGAQLIVSHHPVIYLPPLNRITTDTVLGAKLIRLINNGIAVYSAHTNLDFVKDGINDYAAQLLGLENLTPLDPYISPTEGFGRVGEFAKSMTCAQIAKQAAKAFNDPYCRLIGKDKPIKKAAVINGGGGGDTKYVDMSISAGAQCLITGDIKHHVAVYAADLNFPLIEVNHFFTEHIYIGRLVNIIKQKAAAAGLNIKIIQAME